MSASSVRTGAELAAGTFRGSSRESLRREIRKALLDLKDSKACDALVVLTDAGPPVDKPPASGRP